MLEALLSVVLISTFVGSAFTLLQREAKQQIPALLAHEYTTIGLMAAAYANGNNPPQTATQLTAATLVSQGFIPAEFVVNPSSANATFRPDPYGNTPTIYMLPDGGVVVVPSGTGISMADALAAARYNGMGVVSGAGASAVLKGANAGSAYSESLAGVSLPTSGTVYGYYLR